MATFLISSRFLHEMAEGGKLAVTGGGCTLPGPDSASYMHARSIQPGDLIFIWDQKEQEIREFTFAERRFDPRHDRTMRTLPTQRMAVMVAPPRMALAVPMTKTELHALYVAHRDEWQGYALFKDRVTRQPHLYRGDFCYPVLPEGMAGDLHSRLPGYFLEAITRAKAASHPPAAPAPLPVRPRPTRGPAPTTVKMTVERDAGLEGYTYLLRFGGSDVWKIGWAADPEDRLRDINAHIPIGHIEERWEIHGSKAWPSRSDAHAAEQAFIDRMRHRSVGREQFRCGEAEIARAWEAAVGRPRRTGLRLGAR